MSLPLFISNREKYLANSPKDITTILNKSGVCIIPSKISKEKITHYIDESFSLIEQLTKEMNNPFDRNDPTTFRTFYDLLPLHSMLLQHFKVGHAQYIWDIRTSDEILDIFSEVWQTPKEELLVSFDGISFCPPPELTNRGWCNLKNIKLHCDQSYLSSEFNSIQSFLTLFDTLKEDATFIFFEKSHLLHDKMKEKYFDKKKIEIKKGEDWYQFPPLSTEEGEFFEEIMKNEGCDLISLELSEGDLVLWDSRTIHSGREPLRGRKEINFRSVVYLCYSPRIVSPFVEGRRPNGDSPFVEGRRPNGDSPFDELRERGDSPFLEKENFSLSPIPPPISHSNLVKKRNAFLKMRMTTHSPTKVKLFSKTPRTYGRITPKVPEISPPEVNEIGMKLAGF